MTIQLDLLKPKSEIEMLREEIAQIRDSNHKVRKSLYARHGELCKQYLRLTEEHEEIKSMVMAQYKTSLKTQEVDFQLENAG